jgi:transposase
MSRMDLNTLLADPSAIRLEKAIQHRRSLTLVVATRQRAASCPRCHHISERIHSRYTRLVGDLPWHGIPVRLELHARRFFCDHDLCQQQVFCERLPTVAARYARKTTRLSSALELIGFALGGEAGARIARALGLQTSPDSLIRCIRRTAAAEPPTVRVLGVDDWAQRKGHTYGTILVDLERRSVVDLLPDREAETLAAWLTEHPSVEVVSRDRSRAYANGITLGAPHAIQVADRWHLLKNITDALERLVKRLRRQPRHHRYSSPTPSGANNFETGPGQWAEHYQQALTQVQESRWRNRLLPHLPRARDTPQATASPPPPLVSALPARLRRLPPKRLVWMLLRPEKLPAVERAEVESLLVTCPEVKSALDLVQAFTRVVTERRAHELNTWLGSARCSGIAEFENFTLGIEEDRAAVEAALRHDWSQGQVEGQVNRLKLVKRQMYGRAKFDLLRARVVCAA